MTSSARADDSPGLPLVSGEVPYRLQRRLGLIPPGGLGRVRRARAFEDLRNSLAHAQDIVSHDGTQFARLARRVEELANDAN